MSKAYRINPYIREIKAGEWVSTRSANEYVFARVDDAGNVVVLNAQKTELTFNPSNLHNLMVRD